MNYEILSIETVEKLASIEKAIEKLYCWGEVLPAEFQQEMLKILKRGDNESK